MKDLTERTVVIGAEKQGLGSTKQSDGEVSVGEFPGDTRSGEIDIEEKFCCIVSGDGGDDVGVKEKIGSFLDARGSKVEAAKVMLDEAGLVVEGSGLDGRRWNVGDVTDEVEDIGGDMAELGEVKRQSSSRRRRRRRRRAELGVEVGEADARVPETVTEFP
ncbi:hypothetical protein SO802_000730 [Lithocarpus litseifolius]|uniref:Uncharacterized protein n=1 Tax=Lithocarpus litseifolius TaxID=425828 RepID=A0AAW2DTC0_9ROSI